MSKCPICYKKYRDNDSLHEHMDNAHENSLNGMSPKQYLFNEKYKKTHGTCIVCKRDTEWCEVQGRYERICSERCRNEYREEFKKRMINSHGKIHLLNDPKQQKKMLANRKISGVYETNTGWNHEYTGSFEHEFLKFLDLMMNFPPTEVFSPAPHTFDYEYDGVKHFYIPDFYFPTLNLLVEIKSHQNNHYRARDKHLEKIKLRAAKKAGFKTLTVPDNKFEVFVDYLLDEKNK